MSPSENESVRGHCDNCEPSKGSTSSGGSTSVAESGRASKPGQSMIWPASKGNCKAAV